jgi:large subunit ribosomal protein L3
MPGLIAKKVGMTSIFDENGKNIACTLIQTGPNVVTQVKTVETDGYTAIQVGFDEKKEKRTSAAMKGHFSKASTSPKRKVIEFRNPVMERQLGDELKMEEIFSEGEFVDVVGTSKGKGFQGVVKRHNFGGVGQATHGQHNRLRAPGAIGACATPSRVFKGLRMAGRTGGKRVKVMNLRVMKMYPQDGLILLSGAIPGAKNSYVILEK